MASVFENHVQRIQWQFPFLQENIKNNDTSACNQLTEPFSEGVTFIFSIHTKCSFHTL